MIERLRRCSRPYTTFHLNLNRTHNRNKLPNLQYLNLKFNRNNISDDGIAHLKKMSSLRYLDLRHTKVTDGGVNKLKNHLPDCQIIHESTQ